MTLRKEPQAPSGSPFPWVSVSALVPPVISVLAWMLLELSANSLQFLAGVAMALVFAFGVVLCLGGVLAALMGLRAGESPRALGRFAMGLNVLTIVWLVSVLR